MTSLQIEQRSRAGAGNLALLAAAFTAALLLSALLLFSVQPMFTKMVLPVLGGSPGVWSVAMVFFQSLLLAGYVYAWLLMRWFDVRTAALLHLALCACAFFALPVSASAAAGGPPDSAQALWLTGVFAAATGLPFFALSANGPLLQAWFARSDHARASNPYFLYGASNIGSFAALLAYPFLIEPFAGLTRQSEIWMWGFAALTVLIALCAVLVLRYPANVMAQPGAKDVQVAAVPTRSIFVKWMALAAVPSGLLVAVTAHISTDIAAAPLLWVLPLALYLLTFVIVFRDKLPAINIDLRLPYTAAVAMILLLTGASSSHAIMGLVVNLGFFLAAALICHRTLYLERPSAQYLTVYYVAMSAGGVLGGLFAGLIAPALFPSVWEYPVLAAASLLCLPGFAQSLRAGFLRAWIYPAIICVAVITVAMIAADWFAMGATARIIAAVVMSALMIAAWRRPVAVAVFAAGGVFAATVLHQLIVERQTMRSFFGVHKIREAVVNGQTMRVLMHGTTMHGAAPLTMTADQRPQPTAYYAMTGAIGEAISATREAYGPLGSIFAIGLGTGALACHPKPDERIVFFEIDPLVIKLARDPSLFPFLSRCAPQAQVRLGDARLTIGKEEGKAGVIIIDAFSSDAIPVHLITIEAMKLYLEKLAERGVLVFHISNNVMDLAPVIARAGAFHGLVAWQRTDTTPPGVNRMLHASSRAIVLARSESHLGAMAAGGRWNKVEPQMGRRPWSDDYSTILEPVLDFRRARAAPAQR